MSVKIDYAVYLREQLRQHEVEHKPLSYLELYNKEALAAWYMRRARYMENKSWQASRHVRRELRNMLACWSNARVRLQIMR